ncbi:MAG: TetR/AcrR family transcriptional regulator [Bacteroidia bacterium]|nr:TetR/AcrR family transcriptional regulator [Bacteroidia bacterium]
MPKTREQNQQIKDERKAAILSTALKLFAIRGYDSVVVGDITKEANCSHGLFYHYFANKREIFLELLNIAEKRTAEKRKNEQVLDKTPAIEAIRLIASRMLEEIYQEGESPYFLYMFINMHLQKTIPEPPNLKLRGPKRPFFHFFTDLVARGQKEGDITGGDPKEIAIIYFSIIKGLCYTRLNMKEKVPTKPSIDIIMNLFIRKGNQ